MDSESILNEIANEKGWDESDKLELCLEYINNQRDNDCFEDFLQGKDSEL